MPTYSVRSVLVEEDSFWIYGIDEWDARNQIEMTLGLDAHNDRFFKCNEEPHIDRR
jgi:hypothetical protein